MKNLLVLLCVFVLGCSQLEPQCPLVEIDGIEKMQPNHRHIALADRYDDLYKQYIDKAIKQQAILNDYEKHSQYYGRQGLDVESHTKANLEYYNTLAKKAKEQAAYHRSMALKLTFK